MSSIHLEGVTKRYPNGVVAVEDLTLSVEDGEFVVLDGPSGCGKTTTLRMVAGLEDASAGTIRFGERVVNDLSPKERDVAMVFQNYALYPHMTVRENIGFALKLVGVERTERERRIAGPPRCSASSPSWIANPLSSRAASASGWPWAVRSCVSRTSS